MPRAAIASAFERRARFGQARRLLRAVEFDATIASRASLRGEHFELHFKQTNRAGPARLGLIVPKRLIPTAVARNGIKRQGREAFRLMEELPMGRDCVLRLRRAPKDNVLDARVFRREIESLLARVR